METRTKKWDSNFAQDFFWPRNEKMTFGVQKMRKNDIREKRAKKFLRSPKLALSFSVWPAMPSRTLHIHAHEENCGLAQSFLFFSEHSDPRERCENLICCVFLGESRTGQPESFACSRAPWTTGRVQYKPELLKLQSGRMFNEREIWVLFGVRNRVR